MPLDEDMNDDLGEYVQPPKVVHAQPPKIVRVSMGHVPLPKLSANSNWKKFLASLTAVDILSLKRVTGKAQLIVVDSTKTAGEVLTVLAENSILSAPLVERRNSSVKFVGFVDVLDILGLVVKVTAQAKTSLHEYFSNPFFETPIRQAMTSTLSEWTPIQETANLFDVLNIFLTSRSHRLPIVDHDGRVIGVISQTDMIKMANENVHLLGDNVNSTVEDLGIVHAVIAVRHTAKTIDALSILCENRVHGVAVVEPMTNKLLANLSASDMRGMRREDLGLFDKTVMEFLESVNVKRGGVKSPVWCPLHSTLLQVITSMASQNVHRVYIANEKQQAIGVVSVSDIMCALMKC